MNEEEIKYGIPESQLLRWRQVLSDGCSCKVAYDSDPLKIAVEAQKVASDSCRSVFMEIMDVIGGQ